MYEFVASFATLSVVMYAFQELMSSPNFQMFTKGLGIGICRKFRESLSCATQWHA